MGAGLPVFFTLTPPCSPCLVQATVGAGLPVISTLRSLIETGDKILKIEGVLSGDEGSGGGLGGETGQVMG